MESVWGGLAADCGSIIVSAWLCVCVCGCEFMCGLTDMDV